MAKRARTREELAAWFLAKASEPPPAANLLLARHLQCKESCDLSRAVHEAIRQYAGREKSALPTPGELLPPLM